MVEDSIVQGMAEDCYQAHAASAFLLLEEFQMNHVAPYPAAICGLDMDSVVQGMHKIQQGRQTFNGTASPIKAVLEALAVLLRASAC